MFSVFGFECFRVGLLIVVWVHSEALVGFVGFEFGVVVGLAILGSGCLVLSFCCFVGIVGVIGFDCNFVWWVW